MKFTFWNDFLRHWKYAVHSWMTRLLRRAERAATLIVLLYTTLQMLPTYLRLQQGIIIFTMQVDILCLCIQHICGGNRESYAVKHSHGRVNMRTCIIARITELSMKKKALSFRKNQYDDRTRVVSWYLLFGWTTWIADMCMYIINSFENILFGNEMNTEKDRKYFPEHNAKPLVLLIQNIRP